MLKCAYLYIKKETKCSKRGRNGEKFGSDHVSSPERSHGSTELSSSERKYLQCFGCQETLKQLYKKTSGGRNDICLKQLSYLYG